MARRCRKDRGLLSKRDSTGKLVWYVRLYHEGRERRFGSFSTKTEARKFYERCKLEQEQNRFNPEQYQKSQAELIQTLLDDYLATTTGKRAVKREREFAWYWGNWFRGQRLPALTPAAIERARIDLQQGFRFVREKVHGQPTGRILEHYARPRSGATLNRYTDWLRRTLNWGIKQRRLRENVVLSIERKLEAEAPITQYSLEQEAALIAQLNPEGADMLRLSLLTGMRRANQFLLKKEHVNIAKGLILLASTKNRRPRVIHLSSEGKEILRRQMARHLDSPWIYPGTRNPQRPLNIRWWYSSKFKPACRRAGIPVEDIQKLWHTNRHSFASRLASLNYKEQAIMAAGGWTSSKAAQRYIHMNDQTMQEMSEQLSTLKPIRIPSPTVTGTGIDGANGVDTEAQTVETRPTLA